MAYGKRYGAQVVGKRLSAKRQTGTWDEHPAECECRKCRRMRVAVARRQRLRYGQQHF